METLDSRQLLTTFTTFPLKDFTPGAASSQFTNFLPAGERMLFNIAGDDLWITDGTPAGTVQLGDAMPLSAVSDVGDDGTISFSTSDQRWQTDGTPEGTLALEGEPDLPQNTSQLNQQQVVVNGDTYTILSIDGDKWFSRVVGDATNSVRIAQVPDSVDVHSLAVLNGRVVFFVRDEIGSLSKQPWASDLTAEGTGPLLEQALWPVFASVFVRQVEWQAVVNDVMLFGHDDWLTPSLTYRTDGTPEGTQPFHVGGYIGELDGKHYLAAGSTVVTTDGIERRTLSGELYEAAPPELPGPPVGTSFSIKNGALWKSVSSFNSSPIGPRVNVLLFKLEGTRFVEVPLGSYNVGDDNDAWIETYVGDTRYRVSRSDPSIDRTLADSDTQEIVVPQVLGANQSVVPFTVIKAQDKPIDAPVLLNREGLWALNGGLSLELLHPDEHTGPTLQNPAGNFFVIDQELWATDGTSEAMAKVPLEATARWFVKWQNKTLVIAESPELGQEIWVVDGSYADTPYGGLEATLPNYEVLETDEFASLRVTTNQPLDSGLTYSWDINGDGVFGDATSLTATLSIAELVLLRTKINALTPIAVRIESASGESIVEHGLLHWEYENVWPRTTAEPAVTTSTDRIVAGASFNIELHVTDDEPLMYQFDFGDGNVIQQDRSTASHTYDRAGQYQVELWATDVFGASRRWLEVITVEPQASENFWVFQPGFVFGGDELTVDVELLDTNWDGISETVFATVTNDWNQWWNLRATGTTRPPTVALIDDPSDFDSRSIYGAVADINNNQRLQRVVATFGAGLQGWTLGDPTTLSYDVALGDLDGDKDLDLFVANYQNGEFEPTADWVFINDGEGSLETGSGFTDSGQRLGNYESRSVELGDLDGDGDLDAVTAGLQPDTNHIWFNDGTGQFTESDQRLGPGGEHVAMGDLDGDGDLDLFALTGGANYVWFNDGSGQFQDSGQRLGNASSSHIMLGDLDLDGDLDAYVGNWEGHADTIWANDGLGTFSDTGARIALELSTEHVALGDIDGDHDLDIVAASWGAPNRIYLNNTRTDVTPDGLEKPYVEAIEPNIAAGQLVSLEIRFDQRVEAHPGRFSLLRPDGEPVTFYQDELTWSAEHDHVTWTPTENVNLLADTYTLSISRNVENTRSANLDVNRNASSTLSDWRYYYFDLKQPVGDINGDFAVDFNDFLILSENFAKTDATPEEGDLDGDGKVAFTDFLLLSQNFGKRI